MKTDTRAYAWALTGDLADIAGKQGLSKNDVFLIVCNGMRATGNPECDDSEREDWFELIDPQYVGQWVDNHVEYSIAQTRQRKGLVYSHLCYHGKEMTASKISKMTGLQVNTIYIYWSKCGKDPEAFDLIIDRRLQRYKACKGVNEAFEDWEVDEQ